MCLRKARIGLGAIGLAAAGCLGAAVVSFWPQAAPASFRPSDAGVDVPVSPSDFSDERTVEVRVTPTASLALAAPRAGRITRFDCTANSEVLSGGSVLSIDGIAVLSLASSVPMWRDLAVGDEGSDVRGLQEELFRLGSNIAVDGKMGQETIRATQSLLRNVGAAADGNTIPLSSIAWLPSQSARVDTCRATLGRAVDEGEEVAGLRSGPPKVAVVNLPADLIPGERVLRLGTVNLPVDASGTAVEDFAELSALAANPLLAEASKPGAKPLSGVLRLAESIVVSSVPPGALVGVTKNRACVVSRGKAEHVVIVGSQLGQTFVTFDAPAPTTISLSPPPSTKCN